MKKYGVLLAIFLAAFVQVQGQFGDDREPEDLLGEIINDEEINENHVLLRSLKKSNLTDDYRLPEAIIPDNYNITIKVMLLEDFRFSGSVGINATVVESTNEISLHYKNLTIIENHVFDANYTEVKIVKTVYNNITHIYTMVLEKHLHQESQVIINIVYEGVLSEEPNGFYRSSYYDVEGNRRWLAATQFEPVYARRAFPCFDEPGMKAKFNIRIERPENYTALSNMPRVSTYDSLGSQIDVFAETPRMSSYIVAFVISDFESLNTNGSHVKIWSNKDIVKDGKFALDFGTRVLNIFGKLFNQTNPVPKTDMVAVPDFAAGAMENWGLITYREHLLIYEDTENTDTLQHSIGETIAHELAHMWFGNLISPVWWEYTWLNEGFANYFQHIGAHLAEPSWQSDGRYLISVVRPALIYDSSNYSVSVSHPCTTPNQINEMFGSITYQKGGSVIRMMAESFGHEVFYTTLQEYIAKNKYSNVKSDDFWEVLQNQVSKQRPDIKVSVKDLMSKWIDKPGHPVLNVKVANDKVHVSQERFLLTSKPGNETWYVPITYTTEYTRNFTSSVTSLWMKNNLTLDIANATKQWIVFNIRGAGFYRVNYDYRSWYRIIKTLNSKNYLSIHEYNRVVLIDDLFNLARGEHISYDVVLDALQYLPRETNYLAFKVALNGLQFMSDKFSGQEDEELLNSHILNLMKEAYKRHGFSDNKEDKKYVILLRGELNSLACKLNHPKCIANAVKTFAKWKKDPSKKVPKNQRSVSYCHAVKAGSSEDWEFLHAQYNKTFNVHERLIILRALGCTKNETLLEKYLLKALHNYDPEHQIHKQDSLVLFQTVAQNSYEGAKYTLQFLAKYQDKVVNHFKENSTIVQIFLTASRSFTTSERVQEFKKYIDENISIYKPIQPYLENILQNAEFQLQWFNKYSNSIKNWLYRQYP